VPFLITTSVLWRPSVAILLVVAVAVSLRLPAAQRGLFHWDEAQYLFAVQPGVLKLRDALGIQSWPRLFPERAPFDREPVPYWAFSTKPGYDLLVMPYGAVAGLTPDSVGFLSLGFGIGTVAVLYRLVRERFDERAAVVAAAVLAVSSYHAFYSGSQSSVGMASFFLLLGVWLYVRTFDRPTPGRFALAGATLAYAYGCHYNILPYLGLIGALQLARLKWRPQDGGMRNVLALGLAFFGVIAAFELFYRIVIPLAYAHVPDVRGAYMAQLRYTFGFFRWVIPSGVERFPTLLLDSEGWLVLGMAAIGWALAVRGTLQDWPRVLLLALPAVHVVSAVYAGFSGSAVFSRMIVTVLPFVALWAGVGLVKLARAAEQRWPDRRVAPMAVLAGIALIAAVGLPRAWAVAHLHAGYQEAAEYVREHGGGRQVSLGLPVDQYYLGSFQGTYSLPTTVEALRQLRNATGVHLLVLDHRVDILEEWGNPLGPSLREFEQGHRPLAVIPNPLATTLLIAAENAMSRTSLARTLNDPRSGEIRIYDVDAFLNAG